MSYPEELPHHLRPHFVRFEPNYALAHIVPKHLLKPLKKYGQIIPYALSNMWGDWLDIKGVALFYPTDELFRENIMPACDAYSMLWAKGLRLAPLVMLWIKPQEGLTLWKSVRPETTYLVLSTKPIPYSSIQAIREEKSFAM